MRKGQRPSRNMSETHNTGGPLVDVILLIVWEIKHVCSNILRILYGEI